MHGRNRTMSVIATLDFRSTNFDLFDELLGGIHLVRALKAKGV